MVFKFFLVAAKSLPARLLDHVTEATGNFVVKLLDKANVGTSKLLTSLTSLVGL